MATTSNMFMYSLTIQPPSAITQALLGQFAGTKDQQIVMASGSRLTLMGLETEDGKAIGKTVKLLTHDIFGIIRAMSSFRLAGSHKGELAQLPYSTLHLHIPRTISDSRCGLRFGGMTCPWPATTTNEAVDAAATATKIIDSVNHHLASKDFKSLSELFVVAGQGQARMLTEPGSRRWLEAVLLNMVSDMVLLRLLSNVR